MFYKRTVNGGIKSSFVVSDEGGNAAIEFALVAPMFIALVLGVLIYGIYLTTWIAVSEGASDAARASVAGLDAAERTSLATAELQNFFSAYAPLLSYANVNNFSAATNSTNSGLFTVSFSYSVFGNNFKSLTSLLPIPTTDPTISVTVSNGGY